MANSCCAQSKTIFAGNTLRLDFLFQDGDGAALDITGSTIVWSLFAQRGQPAVLAYTAGVDPEFDIIDATAGKTTLDVPGSTTATLSPGSYLYQIDIELPGPPITEATPISGAVITIKAKL